MSPTNSVSDLAAEGSRLVAKGDAVSGYVGKSESGVRGGSILTIGVNEKRYSFQFDYAGLVTCFFLSDEERVLLSIWSSGSSYHVVIFRFEDEVPLVVDDVGSKSFPDIVRTDGGWMVSMRRIESVVVLSLTDGGCVSEKRVFADPNTYLKEAARFVQAVK